MKPVYKFLLLFNLVLLLVYINWSIMQKEHILSTGKLVLLELAPADTRSLLEGHHMRLDYQLTEKINAEALPKRGFCVFTVNSATQVASRVRFTNLADLNGQEVLMKYYFNERSLSPGAAAYPLKGNTAEQYSQARYGGLRVDSYGNSVLEGLYDEHRQLIAP